MATTKKLSEVYSSSKAYTVLELIKALSDAMDDNYDTIKEDIKNTIINFNSNVVQTNDFLTEILKAFNYTTTERRELVTEYPYDTNVQPSSTAWTGDMPIWLTPSFFQDGSYGGGSAWTFISLIGVPVEKGQEVGFTDPDDWTNLITEFGLTSLRVNVTKSGYGGYEGFRTSNWTCKESGTYAFTFNSAGLTATKGPTFMKYLSEHFGIVTSWNIYSDLTSLKTEYLPKVTSNVLYEKNIYCFGDSLTYGSYNDRDKTWVALIGDRTGAIMHNLGASGACLASYDTITDDTTTENAGIAEKFVTSPTTYIPATMADEMIYITICFGANDRAKGVPLGLVSDNILASSANYEIIKSPETDENASELHSICKTFYGALYAIYTKIMLNYPKAKVLFMNSWIRTPETTNTDTNLNEEDYADAILDFCQQNNIYCLDTYHTSGIDLSKAFGNKFPDYDTAFDYKGDNHFTDYGNEYISTQIEAALKSR